MPLPAPASARPVDAGDRPGAGPTPSEGAPAGWCRRDGRCYRSISPACGSNATLRSKAGCGWASKSVFGVTGSGSSRTLAPDDRRRSSTVWCRRSSPALLAACRTTGPAVRRRDRTRPAARRFPDPVRNPARVGGRAGQGTRKHRRGAYGDGRGAPRRQDHREGRLAGQHGGRLPQSSPHGRAGRRHRGPRRCPLSPKVTVAEWRASTRIGRILMWPYLEAQA